MDIREKGYRHWEGELRASRHNWLPISCNGIHTVFKKKYAKLIFSLCASTFFVFLAAVYVSTKPELKILGELVRLLKSDAELFNTFYTNGFLTFMLIILSIFSGADLISTDLKFKAFPLYFAAASLARRLPGRQIRRHPLLPAGLHPGAGHAAAAVQDAVHRQPGRLARCCCWPSWSSRCSSACSWLR